MSTIYYFPHALYIPTFRCTLVEKLLCAVLDTFHPLFLLLPTHFFTIRPGFLLIMPLFIQIPHPQYFYLLKLPYSLKAKLRVILILLACINITHLFVITEPPLKFLYTTWNTLPYMTGISNSRNWPLREHINQNSIRKKNTLDMSNREDLIGYTRDERTEKPGRQWQASQRLAITRSCYHH